MSIPHLCFTPIFLHREQVSVGRKKKVNDTAWRKRGLVRSEMRHVLIKLHSQLRLGHKKAGCSRRGRRSLHSEKPKFLQFIEGKVDVRSWNSELLV